MQVFHPGACWTLSIVQTHLWYQLYRTDPLGFSLGLGNARVLCDARITCMILVSRCNIVRQHHFHGHHKHTCSTAYGAGRKTEPGGWMWPRLAPCSLTRSRQPLLPQTANMLLLGSYATPNTDSADTSMLCWCSSWKLY